MFHTSPAPRPFAGAAHVLVLLTALAVGLGLPAPAANAQEQQPPQARAQDLQDLTPSPDVAVKVLKKLLLPLTKDELEQEAVTWRDALKAQVRKISVAEIAYDSSKVAAAEQVEKQAEEVAAKEAEAEQAASKEAAAAEQVEAAAEKQAAGEGQAPAAVEADAKRAEADKQAAEAEAERVREEQERLETDNAARKAALTDELVALREQRSALVERTNVVLDALEQKGGEVEEHRLYVTAVDASAIQGVEDLTDTGALWASVQHWLTSETGGLRWAGNIVMFLLVLIGFRVLAGLLARVTGRAMMTIKKVPELLRVFFVNAVRNIVFVIGIVIALSQLEVNVTPLIAAIGATGLVLGFALQGTLSNFASGIMILVYRPYDLGDVVQCAGVSGKVEAMSLVSTTITTFDNQKVIVPNSSIWGDVITNVTGKATRRVDMKFGIGYGDDPDKAQAILEEIVAAHPLVLRDPEPTIKMHELADSSVNFIVRPWARTADYWEVYWDTTRAVKRRFVEEGISIPFPQRDVHLHGEVAQQRALA